ncbi:hypothetical protein JCM11251_006635 [Rhodosporidiobolus azoricus]
MALTIAMLVSSLLGYVTLGCAIAAFIPLIVTNAVQRRSGTGPIFLLVWLIADVLNLVGIIMMGPQITQIFLAAWYFIADLLMLLQLVFFGHSDWPAPPSKPTSNFLAKQKRKKRPLWNRLCEQFISFSVWDDVKLLVSCILAGISWWGIYLLVQVSKDPDFEVHHKTEISDQAFYLGLAGSLTFAAARIPECVSGWRRSARNDKPEHSLDDALFYFLVAENIFNILSIVTLSQDPKYLWHTELPWLLGGFIPIAFDSFILFSTFLWQKKWKDSPKGEAYIKQEGKRQEILDRIEEHKLELQEEWLAEDLKESAKRTNVKPAKGQGVVGKYKAKKDKAAYNAQKKILSDYTDNLTKMAPYHKRAKERAQGLHGGSPFARDYRTSDNPDSSNSEGSDDEKAALSRITPVHDQHRRHSSLPMSLSRSSPTNGQAAYQEDREERTLPYGTYVRPEDPWIPPYGSHPTPENPHGYRGHK